MFHIKFKKMVTLKEFKYFAERLKFLGDSYKGFSIYPSTDKLELVVSFFCEFSNV